MRAEIRNLFLLPALLAGLGIIPAGRVMAQTFSTVYPFTYNSVEGYFLAGGLVLSGNTLLGTTEEGGSGGAGTGFGVNTDGSGFFSYGFPEESGGFDPFGRYPEGTLMLSGETVYGTAYEGGNDGYGTVFSISSAGTFATVHYFTDGSDGSNPEGGVILSGNTLYGTADYGGSAGYGTVFAVNTDSTGGRTLYSFTNGSDGAFPISGLVLSGGTLYGVASEGGKAGYGTVFAINTNNSGFSILYSFTNGGDGAFPYGRLILAGNILYGTTFQSGGGRSGTVFAVNTNGSNFATLHNFSATNAAGLNNDGAFPQAGLVLSGNTLYGTATGGGSNGFGTVFAVNTGGTVFTPLYSFIDGTDGAYPLAGLLLSSNILYGTTSEGGSGGGGTVFSLELPASLPVPVLTWASPASITYGAALTATQLNATTSVPGSFAYTPASGAVLNTGNNTLTVIFTPTDTVDYNGATNSVSLVVSPATLTVTAASASRAAGQPNPAFTGTITGLTNGDNITATYSCSATTSSPAGTFPILPVLVDPNNRQTNYTVIPVDGTLTVNQPQSVFAFSSPAYTAHEHDGSVTLTVVNGAGLSGVVNFQTMDLSAVGGAGISGDYTSRTGSLTFATNQLSQTLIIQVIDNYINGPDLQFTVQLFGASIGTVGAPATVTIIRDDGNVATDALLQQVSPTNRPAMNGQLTVFLPPSADGGQWRFPWDNVWRNSGDTATNLVAGDYPLQFRDPPGFLAVPLATDPIVTNAATTVVTNPYYATVLTGSAALGSLTVTTALPGAGWQFVGETSWRASGSTASGLLPDTYQVAFEQVINYITPPDLAVLVSNGMSVPLTGSNYTSAAVNTTGAALPQQLPTGTILDYRDGPYGFSGQLQTDVGSGSGAAVTPNVVLTAAHMVFNDNTLAYVSNAFWSFQAQAGVFQPEPQPARGWYVLSGYATQRTNDLNPAIGGLQPDQSSPQSRDLDVAALYFLTYSARTGFGGYISSDAVPNPFLTGTSNKTLVGYPVDGSLFNQVVLPGAMYATSPGNLQFFQTNDQVYASSSLFSYPGNSGGPLCVQYANGSYYPAAVYLGTLFNISGQPSYTVVRAIDSNVVNLITMASEKGDSGATNNSGGGVVTFIPSTTTGHALGFLNVLLSPPAAVQAGAAWKFTNQPAASYLNNASSVQTVTNTNNLVVQFNPIPGWTLPASRSLALLPYPNITVLSAAYTVTNPALLVDPVKGLGISGTTNTKYQIQSNSTLTGGTWIPFKTNTLASFGFNLITNHPSPGFYRALWLTNSP